MKVLIVAPSPPPYGGMALQARQLERLLRQDGVEVVFSASNPEFPARLRLLGRIPGLRTCLRTAMAAARQWREAGRVDVIHIFAASWLYFFLVVAPAALAGRARGTRVVLNYRGGEAADFFRRFGAAVRPIFRIADAVTAPSEFLATIIRNYFHVPVAVVPNILDTSKFQYRRRPAFSPALLVNRHLEGMYDIESVLRAFRVVQDRYPHASLAIAGSGSQEQMLRQLASSLELEGVAFLGAVPHAEMPALYDRCDILINASRVDNFPGALVEASAAGLAVVSTGAGGIPAIYKDGDTALLVEPGDWKSLAAGVLRLIESPDAASAMAERAAAIARACAWSEVKPRVLECYGAPANGHRAGAAPPANAARART